MIRGTTRIIAHIGYPTHTFKAPMIYNPYFEHAGIDAVVVPMACEPEPYPALLRAVFALANIVGALITTSPTNVSAASRDTSTGSGSPCFMPSGVAFTTNSCPAGSLLPLVTRSRG